MKHRMIIFSVMAAIGLCVPALSIASTDSTASGSSATGTSSNGCSAQQQAVQKAEQAAEQNAQNIYQNVPAPTNLQSSTCFSNILNMGSNIGISFFNPSSLLKQVENMACQAAQNAVQWPVQQAENYVNTNAQLPDGLGGVSVGSNGTGSTSVTTNSDTAGPSLSIPSTGNSTLNNILG